MPLDFYAAGCGLRLERPAELTRTPLRRFTPAVGPGVRAHGIPFPQTPTHIEPSTIAVRSDPDVGCRHHAGVPNLTRFREPTRPAHVPVRRFSPLPILGRS